MKARSVVTFSSIVIAFFVGRYSAQRATVASNPVQTMGASACQIEQGDSVGRVSSASKPAQGSTPVASGLVPAAKPGTRGTADCLEKVSRRDVAEWMAVLDERMEQFQKTDPLFASKNKMSAADWKKTESSGDLKGVIAFKFESAISAQIGIQFKQSELSYSIVHRNPKDRADQRTASGSHPFHNGYGVGLDHDGSGYHVVFVNPIEGDDWAEYSNFAFTVPYDWDRKPEISADVYGLNESMKWVAVGTARLTRAP